MRLRNIDDTYTLHTIPSTPTEQVAELSTFERQLARVKIEKIEDDTNMLREVTRTMLVVLPIWGLSFPAAMLGFFLEPIQNPNIHDVALKVFPFLWVLLSSFAVCAFLRVTNLLFSLLKHA